MEQLLSITGSILLGIGALGIVWFMRNLFRPRYNKAMAFQQYKGILILIILVLITAGIVLSAIGGKVIYIGIALGVIVGWIVSR